MKKYYKHIRADRKIFYSAFNNNYYIVDCNGSAAYLALTENPEKDIKDNCGIPYIMHGLPEELEKAKRATEAAVFIESIPAITRAGDRRPKLRIFTDETGTACGYDNRLFADFEEKPTEYKLYKLNPRNSEIKALAAFRSGVLLGLIMPVRLKNPAQTLEEANRIKKEKEEAKQAAKEARAAKKAAFAAMI